MSNTHDAQHPTDTSQLGKPAKPSVPPPAPPLNREDLLRVARRPHEIAELILADWQRITASIAQDRNLIGLLLLLTMISILAPLPYGLILEGGGYWKLPALFAGSLLICFPSLHIFSAYLGCKVRVEQNLVLAMIITAVAGLFTFGFAPIFWFLKLTMTPGSSAVSGLSDALLSVSLLAGVTHQARCLFLDRSLRPANSQPIVILFWWCLLSFITYRMSITLGL